MANRGGPAASVVWRARTDRRVPVITGVPAASRILGLWLPSRWGSGGGAKSASAQGRQIERRCYRKNDGADQHGAPY